MGVTSRKWADGPFELIPSTRLGYKKGDKVKGSHEMAVEMVVIHNIILRGINSVYLQCVNVERDPGAVADFVNYASVWAGLVKEHHDGEEELIFPELEELVGAPGIMAANVDQHHAFHDGLMRYDAYLTDVKAGKETYDGAKLRALIDSFMPVLREHLSDEIDTLLALDKYEDKADLGSWFQDIQQRILDKQKDPNIKWIMFPWVLANHDRVAEDGYHAAWPPLPWIGRLLINWIFFPWHKKWWRFAPCDSQGRPKELPYSE